jgi:murein DD-endopeptidase MepM/ murein hydrolase activator NlpD
MKQLIEDSEGYATGNSLQVVLIHPRVGKTRAICLRKGMLFSTMFLFPLFSCIFYLGTQYGFRQAQQDSDPRSIIPSSNEMESSLARPAEVHLDALALRLGQLQSQMLRLNAMGQRVVEELDIAHDEFDFVQMPALSSHKVDPNGKPQRYEDLAEEVDTFSLELHEKELQLQAFSELLTERELEMEMIPDRPPVRNGRVTSSYGWRTDPFTGMRTFHSGVDFTAKRGAKVFAVASGLVIWASSDGGYGKLVAIDHGDGYVTRYAHNKHLMVTVGDRVNKGDAIALMGSTGHSTGPHVHFEVVQDGKKINPWKFIRKAS